MGVGAWFIEDGIFPSDDGRSNHECEAGMTATNVEERVEAVANVSTYVDRLGTILRCESRTGE